LCNKIGILSHRRCLGVVGKEYVRVLRVRPKVVRAFKLSLIGQSSQFQHRREHNIAAVICGGLLVAMQDQIDQHLHIVGLVVDD
jgi:hypothetical protein